MIHTDDAASAFVAVAEQPKNGVWHIVDKRIGHRARVPWGIRLAAGRAPSAPYSHLAGEMDCGRASSRLFHTVDADDQCAAQTRFRLDAALRHVPRRARPDRRRVENRICGQCRRASCGRLKGQGCPAAQGQLSRNNGT